MSLSNKDLEGVLKPSLTHNYHRLIAYWRTLKEEHPAFVEKTIKIITEAHTVLDGQLALEENPLLQQYLTKTPLTLKDRITGLSDFAIKEALTALCDEWKEILSADEHKELLTQVTKQLTMEKEFLYIRHDLTYPVAWVEVKKDSTPQESSPEKKRLSLSEDQQKTLALLLDPAMLEKVIK